MNITTSGTYQIGGTTFIVTLGAAVEVALPQVNLRGIRYRRRIRR